MKTPILRQPQRWITEITPSGVIRHTTHLAPDHIVITLHDLPAVLSDKLLVDDALADRAFNSLIRRAG